MEVHRDVRARSPMVTPGFHRAVTAGPLQETARCGHLTASQVLEQDLSEADRRESEQQGGVMEQSERHRLPNVLLSKLNTSNIRA